MTRKCNTQKRIVILSCECRPAVFVYPKFLIYYVNILLSNHEKSAALESVRFIIVTGIIIIMCVVTWNVNVCFILIEHLLN